MASSRDKAMTDVQSWYSGKNFFITGGSGFLGICLLEKILRTIPDVGTIYLLLRPKKGKEISERLGELKKNLVFERLLENKSVDEVFERVKAVAGDVGQPDLGISEEDRRMLTEHVNVFVHSAATLDFKEPLKLNVDINLLGTRRCLELAKQCRKLAVFVHVSSAYVNSYMLDCKEIIYDLTEDIDKLIKLSNTKTEDEMEELKDELLGAHPNTYTFTKQMAEHEVRSCEANFPCAIVRPSMIVGAWREPLPGWTISKNGPQGFLMGAAKGVIRRLPIGKDLVYDYIPVDIVVNELLVAGFYSGLYAMKEVQVYHCTSSTTNPFRWANVEDRINGYLHRYPLVSAVWYPHLKFLPSLKRYFFSAFFVHQLPAIVLDFVTKLTGGRPILCKLHRNVNESLTLLEKFIFTEWAFHNERTTSLQRWMLPGDQQNFNVVVTDLSWPEYFDDLTQGARRYLNKENMKNIQAARGKDTLLMVIHLGFQACLLALVWFLFACLLGSSMASSSLIVPIMYILLSSL